MARAMAKAGTMLIAAASLPLSEASRKVSGEVSSLAAGNSTDSGDNDWSHWTIQLSGVGCMAMTFTPFEGIEKGLYESCKKKAIKEGQEMAVKHNCRICDVTLNGKKPDSEQSWSSNSCEASVTCAASRIPVEDACFSGTGKLGAIKNLNSGSSEREASVGYECHTCPPECKECIYDNSYTAMASFKKQFKCIMSPTGDARTEGVKCSPPSEDMWKCGKCKNRNCGGMFNYACSNSDFKTACDLPKNYVTTDDAVDEKYRDYKFSVSGGANKLQAPWLTIETLFGSKP
eukprot:TRINITY_DN12426_c0_g1_i1.p1 TRINITY_DN12426_c0_g1~~TRINITY_DN12426_c0_g1_i1.p1  ORF type:complete len:288 (-),score=67.22 TRINITY_DN12426_c0_g1_i1:191-1054(-)